jgi:hypothetical protein
MCAAGGIDIMIYVAVPMIKGTKYHDHDCLMSSLRVQASLLCAKCKNGQKDEQVVICIHHTCLASG